jgi:hypothetical protein
MTITISEDRVVGPTESQGSVALDALGMAWLQCPFVNLQGPPRRGRLLIGALPLTRTAPDFRGAPGFFTMTIFMRVRATTLALGNNGNVSNSICAFGFAVMSSRLGDRHDHWLDRLDLEVSYAKPP